MKCKLTVQQFVCLAFVALAVSCTKTNTINIQQPTACFTTLIKVSLGNYFQTGDATFIDSVFLFRNCSDSSELITYSWDFGDGASSAEKSPLHSYSRRGSYKVTLTVNDNDLAFDTIQQIVTVISGQKEIGFGENTNAYPIAIDETASGDFLLLGSRGWDNNYFLMQTDSLFRQKGQPRNFPSGYRLNSMKPAGDGNYVFTGTTTGFTRNNELIKLTPDGANIWNRVSAAADESYISVSPSPDGGYIVVSSFPVKDQYNNPIEYSRVKKFDGNGSLQWERSLFTEGMQKARDVVVEQDAVIIAGKARLLNCLECDSIMIAKLNNTGGLVWKTVVYGGLNTSLNNMRLIKQSNGNYVVATESARGIFIFSSAGAFLDRKLVNNPITAISNTGDGNLAVLQTESGNGFRAAISKIKMDGTSLWYVIPNGQQQTATGWSCCNNSWPVSIQPLRNGGTLALMQRVNNTANYNYYYVMSFLPLRENGSPK
ncbi:MAG: PKD domain-containing protein [Candidatus Pseudobacter hemicellulosilyticus]|uniref:PKD domain-containing protein n=1 Tax=Candidatus Pseudobacter hemicellulosilyticus TaxID=3121375 RepID=A0AAJ5WM83_9BACT|nr:MAG: PKD domain-containing protein [Pseudobacter sp.]